MVTLFLGAASLPAPTHAQNLGVNDEKIYRQAFAALERGSSRDAIEIASRASDRTLREVVQAEAMGQAGSGFEFRTYQDWLQRRSNWPQTDDWRRMAERLLPEDWAASQVLDWFERYPPLTYAGISRRLDALFSAGQRSAAAAQAQADWRNFEFAMDDEADFLARYRSLLTSADHAARLERLLWEEEWSAATRMTALLPDGWSALVRAHQALANESSNAPSLLAAVPSSLQDNSALQFQYLRWLRERERDREAAAILRDPPSELGRAEEWWKERHIIIRRYIERRDMDTAYALAKNHGQTSGVSFSQAEFMLGWLALRFMREPSTAVAAFERLYRGVSTPVSKSRGAYWLGRALQASGDQTTARQWYETAAAYPTTFYGQLALATISPGAPLNVREPQIPEALRRTFMAEPAGRAVRQLVEIGQDSLATEFMENGIKHASERSEIALWGEVARGLRRADLMVEIAKFAAMEKGVVLTTAGYPTLDRRLPSEPEAALIHAIIRQESVFVRDAVSKAGARGLMQLLPSTARQVGRNLGMRVRDADLFEPNTNIRLGSAYLQQRIENFGGSWPLAIASYNAGAGRIRSLMTTYGDPREPEIDPIDWIELIPIAETRNYVQRVLENVQVYRARLQGGSAPLRILEDLR